MKNILLAGIAALGLFASCEQPAEEATTASEVKLNNFTDSLSYSIGSSYAEGLVKNFEDKGEINEDVLIAAFQKTLKGEESLFSEDINREISQKYMQQQQESEQQKNADYLEANKLKEGVQVTESGLQYKVITMGEGEKPSSTSEVTVHYHGTLITGDVFDSSVERGQPASFPLNQVIPGWTEGLQLMPIGSKFEFTIPFDLAYGPRGRQGSIPPYATLIFEVELLEIAKPEASAAGHEGHAH